LTLSANKRSPLPIATGVDYQSVFVNQAEPHERLSNCGATNQIPILAWPFFQLANCFSDVAVASNRDQLGIASGIWNAAAKLMTGCWCVYEDQSSPQTQAQ
jgi:hypothetical protein